MAFSEIVVKFDGKNVAKRSQVQISDRYFNPRGRWHKWLLTDVYVNGKDIGY